MSTKARADILAASLIVSSLAIAAGEADPGSCCLLPGGAKGLAPHVQNMRWETHGISPVTTGERHVIERAWLPAE
jgi:hypothetical protein